MKDRQATKPGRIALYEEIGDNQYSSTPKYYKITMADTPTEAGTPLNKSTFLSDATSQKLFGNTTDRTVNEAFDKLITGQVWSTDNKQYKLHVDTSKPSFILNGSGDKPAHQTFDGKVSITYTAGTQYIDPHTTWKNISTGASLTIYTPVQYEDHHTSLTTYLGSDTTNLYCGNTLVYYSYDDYGAYWTYYLNASRYTLSTMNNLVNKRHGGRSGVAYPVTGVGSSAFGKGDGKAYFIGHTSAKAYWLSIADANTSSSGSPIAATHVSISSDLLQGENPVVSNPHYGEYQTKLQYKPLFIDASNNLIYLKIWMTGGQNTYIWRFNFSNNAFTLMTTITGQLGGQVYYAGSYSTDTIYLNINGVMHQYTISSIPWVDARSGGSGAGTVGNTLYELGQYAYPGKWTYPTDTTYIAQNRIYLRSTLAVQTNVYEYGTTNALTTMSFADGTIFFVNNVTNSGGHWKVMPNNYMTNVRYLIDYCVPV